MVRVMATGVFDIIHMGHIHFLREAKKLGDELVVVVARDSTASKRGKETVMDENSRFAIVSELKIVDRAVLGREGDIYETVRDINPDVIALGYDQKFNTEEILKGCQRVGVNARVARLSRFEGDDDASSSAIRKKLLKKIGEQL